MPFCLAEKCIFVENLIMILNPKVDLVFKKLFGSEENKDILMSLINAILPPHQQVVDITLKNPYKFADYILKVSSQF